MTTIQQLMFALQSPVGLRFGTTSSVDSERISFEMDLQIPKGTECVFRMELSGSEETAMGFIRIERVIPKRGTSLPRYVGRILEMPDGNRELFDAWRRDMATGGVSRKLERDPEALKARMAQSVMSGLSPSESKAVLDRMNKRRSSYSQSKGEIKVDLGLTSEEGNAGQEEERNSLRDQLRQKAATKKVAVPPPVDAAELSPGFEPAPEPEPAPAAEPEPAAEPAPEPEPEPAVEPEPAAEPEPVPEPEPEPAPDVPVSPPLIVVNAQSVPIELTVIYLSKESFQADHQASLKDSVLTVDDPNLTELFQPVDVKIQLPEGDCVEVSGQTVAQTPNGMALALAFDAIQRAVLESNLN